MRARAIALAAAVAAGCGRYGYDPVGGDGGPGLDPDAEVVGIADAPAALGSFAPAQPIEELNGSSDDDDPSLTGDLLEIYFKSDRGPGADPDIWLATRAQPGEGFGPARRVDELSSGSFDGTPEVALDGLSILLSSGRPGGIGDIDIWRATRASRDDPWDAPVLAVDLSSAGDDYAATTDGAQRFALVGRDLGPGVEFAILESRRAVTTAPWGAPALVPELDSPGYDADAVLDASGTVVYFGSTRPGGAGMRDLWTAVRPAPDEPFAAPEPVVELGTAGDDEDPWISPDLRTLVFTRDDGTGQELFFATR